MCFNLINCCLIRLNPTVFIYKLPTSIEKLYVYSIMWVNMMVIVPVTQLEIYDQNGNKQTFTTNMPHNDFFRDAVFDFEPPLYFQMIKFTCNNIFPENNAIFTFSHWTMFKQSSNIRSSQSVGKINIFFVFTLNCIFKKFVVKGFYGLILNVVFIFLSVIASRHSIVCLDVTCLFRNYIHNRK